LFDNAERELSRHYYGTGLGWHRNRLPVFVITVHRHVTLSTTFSSVWSLHLAAINAFFLSQIVGSHIQALSNSEEILRGRGLAGLVANWR